MTWKPSNSGCPRSGPGVRFAELFRFSPGLEISKRPPDGMRGIKHVIFATRSAQQVERDETRLLMQVHFTRKPHLLENLLRAGLNFEAVHGDVHVVHLFCGKKQRAGAGVSSGT